MAESRAAPRNLSPSCLFEVPVLAGATASGKTALALELATRLPLEIISADAMMVYRGMDIGTAKPSPAERRAVPHHLIDVIDPDCSYDVKQYVDSAEAAIGEVLARGKLPVVVGGSGFYIRALSQGLPTVPAADAARQAPWWHKLEQQGLAALEAELAAHSPLDAQRAQHNPRRVIRALEILEHSGRPPSSFPNRPAAFRYSKRILSPSPAWLHQRIAQRSQAMLDAGLVAEVQQLLARYPQLPTALQAIGYKEVVAHLRGEQSLEQSREAISQATRQYARRQRTWFRKEPQAEAFSPALSQDPQALLLALHDWLQRCWLEHKSAL